MGWTGPLQFGVGLCSVTEHLFSGDPQNCCFLLVSQKEKRTRAPSKKEPHTCLAAIAMDSTKELFRWSCDGSTSRIWLSEAGLLGRRGVGLDPGPGLGVLGGGGGGGGGKKCW